MISRRRVVVTGIGMVTPLGITTSESWAALLRGESGVVNLDESIVGSDDIAFAKLGSRVAALVPGFHPGMAEKVDVRRMARFTQFAVVAASEALANAGLEPHTEGGGAYHGDRAGCAIGSGIGSLEDITQAGDTVRSRGPNKLSPYFVPRILANMAAGTVAIQHGLRGPSHAASTACATGAHAIGDAFKLVRDGDADLMLAGATEASVNRLAMAGFGQLRALSTAFNECPNQASRPFDAQRDGFVMGEGAAVLVLEELEGALKRGAVPLAEVRGFGLSCDAHHITAPAPDGNGALRAMQAALASSALTAVAASAEGVGSGGGNASSLGSRVVTAEDVDYVNAHATSTPMGDDIEALAIDTLFSANSQERKSAQDTTSSSSNSRSSSGGGGDGGGVSQETASRAAHSQSLPLVSSTKGATGHLLGAAGAVEAAFSVLSIRDGMLPATLNLRNASWNPKSWAHVRPPPGDVEDTGARSTDGRNRSDSDVEEAGKLTTRAESSDFTGLQMQPITVLSNSFGFGGTNAALLFTQFQK